MGDVSGTAYAQLYLSCYGSLLSVAMGYSEADLADWESTRCVTVCTPSSDGRYVPKPINNLTPNLEPDFSHEKLNFQLGSRRQRGYKLLQLNIVHLAVPEPNTLPAYYQGRTLIRVIESLRRILPQDGLAWLEAEVGR